MLLYNWPENRDAIDKDNPVFFKLIKLPCLSSTVEKTKHIKATERALHNFLPNPVFYAINMFDLKTNR